MELLEAFEELPPELRGPLLKVARAIQKVVGESVRREDFLELKEVVNQLAEAQKRTEERLGQLTIRVDQLAEAQKRTEERLGQLTARVDQLAEAQKRTEERLGQLTARVDQLAEAQKRTEERLEQLTARVDQLAEAQRKTEKVLTKLVEDHSETRKRLESMSDAVGYELENKSYMALPILLKRDLDLQIEDRLLRKYILGPDGKRYIQINIYGWGKRNGEKVLILGEAKTSLSKREVNKFMKHVKLISSLEGVHEDHILTVAVVHTITPDVEKYTKEKGIKIYWSYDLNQ